MLLNEFLKEHDTVQELESTVAKQEATIAEERRDFRTMFGKAGGGDSSAHRNRERAGVANSENGCLASSAKGANTNRGY
jgi:hypothetical protein